MRNKCCLLSLGTAICVLFPGMSAHAGQVEFGVYKSLNGPEARCPEKVIVTEQNAPYFEGGYTINGQAKLGSFAGPFAIASSDPFSVTWVANLKPTFSKCVATAGIVKNNGEKSDRHSYLRLRFTGGKVYLILDMTGMRDVNNFTTIILKKGVNAGNPTWSWGGTD